MKKKIAIIIILAQITSSIAVLPCCEEEENNIITRKKCAGGGNITTLGCGAKYLLKIEEEESNINIDVEGRLIIGGGASPVESDRFCYSRLNTSAGLKDIYLVCFNESEINLTHTFFPILAFVSVLFILLTILVYMIVPGLLDLQGKCMINAISGLAVSFLTLGINQMSVSPAIVCHILAYLIYVSFLYAFFWLNILSFHIWRTVVNPKLCRKIKHWMFIYVAYGTLCPLALLIFLILGHNLSELQHIQPGIGEGSCWFKSLKMTFVYFYGPISVLLCLNIFFYVWTIIEFWKVLGKTEEKKAKIMKYRIILCIKLFFILGITWSFEVMSAFFEEYGVSKYVWIITDILNGIQGILIFLILVVFRKKVLRGLANRKFFNKRFPTAWKTAVDDECEEIEEELSLSKLERA